MYQHQFPRLFFVLLLAFLAACQGSQVPAELTPITPNLAETANSMPTPLPIDELLEQFEYDTKISLNVQLLPNPDAKTLGVTLPESVNLSELSYDAPGGAVKAYLVEPQGTGPFAAVLWVHHFPGSKTEFLPEAVSLAGQGVVSILVEGRYPWQTKPGTFDEDRTNIIDQVLDLRRGLDLLETRQDVDAGRLAFVGHDYGAMHGAVLCGVDKRLKASVLMTPTGSYFDWRKYFSSLETAELEKYQRLSPTIDPISFVRRSSPVQLYFQFSQNDRYVPLDKANEFFAAAGEPKQLDTYEASHELDEAARLDRERFLVEVLLR